jgi:hypothetical protein
MTTSDLILYKTHIIYCGLVNAYVLYMHYRKEHIYKYTN